MKLLIVFTYALVILSIFELVRTETTTTSTIINGKYDDRIFNGTAAYEGQFPYQVRLTLTRDGLAFTMCGGSLIGQKWVLTAAHCTQYVSMVHVYLGSTRKGKAEVSYTVYSNDIIIHNGWLSKDIKNDISLIKIPETRLTKKIKIVRLPSMSMLYKMYFDKYGLTSGWGRTTDKSTARADWLQWTRLRIVDNSVCKKFYYRFDGKMKMCVSTSGGSSTCLGDSGGPLVLESEQILVGVTSFGASKYCERGQPVGFTRVTNYLCWIKYHTGIAYY